MKPLLFVLLAVSLAGNVAQFLVTRSSAAGTTSGDRSGSSTESTSAASGSSGAGLDRTKAKGSTSSSTTDAASAASAAGGDTWRQPKTDADLRALVARLRAAGYPTPVIRAVVNQLLNERFATRRPGADQPFWKRSGPPKPEIMAAQQAANAERRSLYESLLGTDAQAASSLDAATREQRYGRLDDAKINALTKIEQDYGEMASQAYSRSNTNASNSAQTFMQIQRMMEAEKLADIAKLLTPQELEEYEMRTSRSASTLMNSLRNVDVSESEYRSLFQAQKAFDAANPTDFQNPSAFAQRTAAQLTLNEQMRSLLGETRFYSYLETADRNYANVAQAFTKFPSVTPATTYQVYQMQNELQSAMASAGGRGAQGNPNAMTDIRAKIDSYNMRLETLVGAEAAASYRTQPMGRMFTIPRNAPRTQ